MYGVAGSGKTSSKELIIGNPPPKERESTPLAVRPATVYRINLEGKAWAKLSTLEERKTFLARALIAHVPNLVSRLLAAQSDNLSPASIHDQTGAIQRTETLSLQPLHVVPPGTSPTSDSLPSNKKQEASSINGTALQSVAIDEDLVKLMDRVSATEIPLADFHLLQMIDSGGQPQFHEILPIFMRQLSFYIFVFRLCDQLSSHPKIEFYVDGKSVGTPYTSTDTIEQLFQHCIRTMHTHNSSSSSSRKQVSCPRILILGTHADKEKKSKETRNQKNEKFLELLLPMLENHVIYSNLSLKEVVFPLNAKLPGDSEYKIAEQIREVLLDDSFIKSADLPLKWFALEVLLEEMVRAHKRGVLSKNECCTAAIEKLHFEEDSFEAAIHYLDELSVLFYYPNILPNIVFADPQILLDKVTELVFASIQIAKHKALSGEWRKFHECALITIKFISQPEFNKHYVPGLFEPKDLVKLFERLLIFATFSNTEYIVPALLHNLDKEKVAKHRASVSSSLPPLAIYFTDGYPMRGIFCSLTCFLASSENNTPAAWSILVDRFRTPVCLYRNCIQFDIPNSPATVMLIDTFTHFEVHVDFSMNASEMVCSKISQLIRKAVFIGLHRALLNLQYFDCSPAAALLCPCLKGETHIATVNVELGVWICSTYKKTCGELTTQQMFWFEQKNEEIPNSDPTLPKLLNFRTLGARKVNIASEIGVNYRQFGTLLLNDETGARVNAIERELVRNAEEINCRILSEWLEGKGIKPVSWNTLVGVLVDIELSQLACMISQCTC